MPSICFLPLNDYLGKIIRTGNVIGVCLVHGLRCMDRASCSFHAKSVLIFVRRSHAWIKHAGCRTSMLMDVDGKEHQRKKTKNKKKHHNTTQQPRRKKTKHRRQA